MAWRIRSCIFAQAARVSRKSELGKALAYMLRRQAGFCLFLDDGHVDMDSNLVENAIRSPAMTRRNTLFAGHDDGARCWARFASLIGTCRMNGVEPYAYLRDLYTKLANGHLEKDIDALMPWALGSCRRHAHRNELARDSLTCSQTHRTEQCQSAQAENINGTGTALTLF